MAATVTFYKPTTTLDDLTGGMSIGDYEAFETRTAEEVESLVNVPSGEVQNLTFAGWSPAVYGTGKKIKGISFSIDTTEEWKFSGSNEDITGFIAENNLTVSVVGSTVSGEWTCTLGGYDETVYTIEPVELTQEERPTSFEFTVVRKSDESSSDEFSTDESSTDESSSDGSTVGTLTATYNVYKLASEPKKYNDGTLYALGNLIVRKWTGSASIETNTLNVEVDEYSGELNPPKLTYDSLAVPVTQDGDSYKFEIDETPHSLYLTVEEFDPTDEDENLDCYAAYEYDGSGGTVEPTDYTVTFQWVDTDGKVTVVQEETYSEGTKISAITPPILVPIRSTGYWKFDGWGYESSDDLITQNLTYTGIFTPGKVVLSIDYAGGSVDGSDNGILTSTWGLYYTDLSEIPTKEGKVFYGLNLCHSTGEVIEKTHDAGGRSIATVTSGALGRNTSNTEDTFNPTGVKLVAIWGDELPKSDLSLSTMRDAIGIVPQPFASDASATIVIPAESQEGKVNFKDGLPAPYEKKLIDANGDVVQDANGDDEEDDQTQKIKQKPRVITRGTVNTFGNIGSQAQFFEQCGGYYTFDQKICDAINGYPKGAVLQFYQESTNALRTVYSLEDDNTFNFLVNGVDGVHWKYIDDNPELGLFVDYSDFIDLSETLFVETGLADLYEVPYDSFLQFHSLSYIDMNSTLRGEQQNFMHVANGVQKNDDGQYEMTYSDYNGTYGAACSGSVYLDVYNAKTKTTNSFEVRKDGSTNIAVSAWQYGDYGLGAFYLYKIPACTLAQGSFFINKGDKIRIRGAYTDRVIAEGQWTQYNYKVQSLVLSDKDVTRRYLERFAMLYRVSWRG